MKDVTVLMPAYQEEEAIGKVIDEVRSVLPDCRILVAYQPSTDRTEAVLKEKGVNYITEPRRGKGYAVRSAIRAVESRYVVMMDSDYTYPARYIPIMVAYMQDGADIVMGYRKIIEKNAMPRINRLGNRGLSLLASGLYGAWMFDVCTGLWGFTEKAMGAMRLTSKGFTLEADIFTNAMRTRCRVEQIPIAYRARPGQSKAKLSVWDGFKIGGHLLRGRFKLSP